VIPEASSTVEKLEMKGEKVDVNSIKNSVMEEMKDVQQRMSKMGKEAKTMASEKTKILSSEMGYAVKRTGRSFGDIIVFLVKAFAYFIVGCVLLGLLVGLFAIAVFAIGVFPFKAYILNDGWQTFYAWGSLLFFIGVPIGIITFIIMRLAKVRRNNKLMGYSFLAFCLLGIFCLVSLIISVGKDFRSTSTVKEETISLPNPGVRKLQVAFSNSNRLFYGRNNFLHIEPFGFVDEDTVVINNVRLRITKSANDSFNVTLVKLCNGGSRRFADTLANKIAYNIQQVDSILLIDKGIAITKQDKFRNQQVIVTVAVPVGKVINISKRISYTRWEHFNGPWHDGDWEWGWDSDWDREEVGGWQNHYDEDLVMKADGLYTLDGKRADFRSEHDWDNEPEAPEPDKPNGYRYEETQKAIDSLNILKEKQLQKMKDSLKKEKDEIDKNLEKLENKTAAKEAVYSWPVDHRDFIVTI
jgi:hypothetical protein